MIISNSELTTYRLCPRWHYYAFVKNLEPNEPNEAISIGLLGHLILEVYYKAIFNGKDFSLARDAALAILKDKIVNSLLENTTNEKITYLLKNMEFYFSYYGREDFEPLNVEEIFTYTDPYGTTWACRPDLIIKDKYGDLSLIDHKFTYDFFSESKEKFTSQLAIYKIILRNNGIHINNIILNQIRYRYIKNSGASNIFRRSSLKYSPAEIDNIWRENNAIIPLLVNNGKKALRTWNDLACRWCPFQVPCIEEVKENNVNWLGMGFKPRQYGYQLYDPKGL